MTTTPQTFNQIIGNVAAIERIKTEIDEAAVQIQAETKRRIQESVSGVLSGSVSASPELPRVHSVSES
jgi:hypothetical protein